MPDSALPDNLKGKNHWDWPWPFKLIPRGWTAFKWGIPEKVFGNQPLESVGGKDCIKPIGPAGTWQISCYPDGPFWAWYLAFTLKSGRHFRIGARWDDVDSYVEFPSVATRKFTGDPNQDTSTN